MKDEQHGHLLPITTCAVVPARFWLLVPLPPARVKLHELCRRSEAIDAEGWMHTGDIGTVDADGYFMVVYRKKELIITSGGKNISPALPEGLMKHHPLIRQAVAVGDGRQFIGALIVLDQEVAPQWAHGRGIGVASTAELAAHPMVVTQLGRGIAEANQHLSRAEQIKRFMVLPAEWTAESEELTPTLKLRRRVVERKYAPGIEAMYADPPGGHPVEEAAGGSRLTEGRSGRPPVFAGTEAYMNDRPGGL